MLSAIRGIGWCAPTLSSRYGSPVMDLSRASHSRHSASSHPSTSVSPSRSFQQPEGGSQAADDTVRGTQSSFSHHTTVRMSALGFPSTSSLPVHEDQHCAPTPGATSGHDNAAFDRTPSWSGPKGLYWDPLQSTSFTDLLTTQFTTYPSEPGPSQ